MVNFMPMAKKTGVNTEELGSAVRRRREQQGLSLRDVAEQTGVSASTLSRIENGTGKPDADNIARLASWLDMPIERVMHHRQPNPPHPNPAVFYPPQSPPQTPQAT